MSQTRYFPCALLLLLFSSCAGPERGDVRPMFIATTTSVADSGLMRHLAATYEQQHGIPLRWLSVGSGRALKMVERGDVTFTITHDPDAERALASRGRVLLQRPFMRNDFVIVGPEDNPASIAAGDSVTEALRKIHGSGSAFSSRGDESGTHARERRLWKAAGIDPSENGAYRALGQPMGALLRSSSELQSYALSDRATFESLAGALHLTILGVEDPSLQNIYVSTVMRPRRERHEELRFADWLVSPAGMAAIEAFKPGGRVLFRSVVKQSSR